MRLIITISLTFICTMLCAALSAAEENTGSQNHPVVDTVSDVLEMPSAVIKKVSEFALKPIVVTPWGTEKYAYNVSKNVSVITSDDIINSGATTFPQLLDQEAGVTTSELLGNPKAANVDIRGFGETSASNVLVLINGRRANQIDMSGVDWAGIDLNMVERIEIVKGGSSVLYGDNATGGVINIITKSGSSKEPRATLGSSLGSYAYNTEYGTLELYQDFMDYFFSYKHRGETGYRENNSYKSNDWFGSINMRPLEGLDLGAQAGFHKDSYGQPGALRQAELDYNGRRGTAYPDDKARTEDFFITGEPAAHVTIGNNEIKATVHGTYRYRETEATNIFTPAWQGLTGHKINSGEIKPKLEAKTLLFDSNIDNTMVLGSDNFVAQDDIASGNILAGRDHADITKRTYALYAYDNAEFLKRFLVNGGYRYEWANYKFEQKGIVTNNDAMRINEWSCEVGSGYKYNPSSQIYANWSRSYRYPATDEYYQSVVMFWGMLFGGLNRQIRQQVGHNFEVGIKDNTLDWLNMNADWFFIDTKKEIYFDPGTFTNTNYSPRTKRYGFDVEARANLVDKRLMPYVNYTRQYAKFDGGIYDNNEIPLVPNNKFSCGVVLVPIKDLSWNTSLNYVGSRFMISDQRNQVYKLGDRTTVDTRLSYKWKGFTIYGAISNVFNKKYYAYGVTNAGGTAVGFYPAPGITYEIGGTAEF